MTSYRWVASCAASFALPLCLACIALAQPPAGKQQAPDKWEGTLDVGVAKLRLVFEITAKADGTREARMISVDQGNLAVGVDRCQLSDGKLLLEMKQIGARFEGQLNKEQTKAEGTFTQSGREFKLTLTKAGKAPLRKLVEAWTGKMVAGTRTFDFQLRVFTDESKKQSAVLDSFSEQLMEIPVDLKRGPDQSFSFVVNLTKARYEGTLNKTGDQVTGNWLQSGGKFELVFRKIPVDQARTKLKPPKRPQNPKPPLPYQSRDLQIKGPAGTLAGTLTLPAGKAPPLAILISGSGPQDRDESLLGHKPFLVLADHLARQGIAAFRFDDRGVGKSTGAFAEATTVDFAEDASAIVKHFKSLPEINPRQIGLVGHSEGGLIAPLAARDNTDVAWIVLLAGPGVTGKQIVFTQSRAIAAAEGADAAKLDQQDQLLKLAFELLESQPAAASAEQMLEELTSRFKATLPEDEREAFELPAAARLSLQQLNSPWFRYFASYDPAPTLRAVRCPVLALWGELDLQVDAKVNSAAIRQAVAERPSLETQVLPGLNHLFQTSKTGSPGEYRAIEETMAPAALDAVSRWILQQQRD